MNCKIAIQSANICSQSECNIFCKIYQPLFDNFQIAETSIKKGTKQFEWNESFECHLIRGIDFIFNIIEVKGEIQQLYGKATLNIFNIIFSEEIVLPIETNIQSHEKNLSNTLTVKIEQIKDTKPVLIKNPTNRIPFNNVIYANLSFNPGFTPTFPYKSSLFDFVCIPLDISFVAFDEFGNITQVVSNSDIDRSKKCCHSKNSLCYCYDTYGPTIRIDLFETFFNKNGNTKSYSPFSNEYLSHHSNTKIYSSFPSIRGVFFVSIFDQKLPIEMYKWISIDLYVSQEKHMKKTINNDIICDRKSSDVYFHSRMPLSLPGKGNVGSFTISSVAVFTADYENRNIEISPLNFSCPNYVIQIPTFSVTEILPEIAQITHVAQFGNKLSRYERRVSCPLGCSASLGRAFYINKFQSPIQKIHFFFSWKYLNIHQPKAKEKLFNSSFENDTNDDELELEASLFAIDNSFKILKTCSMNNKTILNGAFAHSGLMKSSLTEITADFMKIPSNVSYLCFTINSFKKLNAPIKRINFTIQAGNNVLFFSTKKNITKRGFLINILKREMNDWSIIPILKQVDSNTPTLIQKNVIELCTTLFHS